MERGSDKHGPLMDDELKDAAGSQERGAPPDSRAREGRQQEAPGDEEPVPDARTDRADGPAGALGSDPQEARRELGRAIEPSIFPAERGALVRSAERGHARAPVVEALRSLPEGVTFSDLEEVWEALPR